MGLLDDAIREHLDLKRRRGADPTEVERAEREALGPVRRGPEETEQDEPAIDQALAYDHENGQDWGESFDDADGLGSPQPGEPEPFAPEPPSSAPVEPAPVEPSIAHEPFESDESPAETRDSTTPRPHPAPAAPPPEQPREHVGEETVEYEVEAALEQEGERNPDDPLEETPEFLQDTPDHDRLWFEQRPPRDFDFEG